MCVVQIEPPSSAAVSTMFGVRTAPVLAGAALDARLTRLLTRRTVRSSVGSHTVTQAQRGGNAAPAFDSAGARCSDQPRSARPTGTRTNEGIVDFDQTREAYKSKESWELLRSLLVFKLCSYDVLVDKNKEIMDLAQRLLGRRAFEQFMKMTFYGQFVAGEDHKAIRPLIEKNQAFGVGSVLDYSVEEDISEEEATESLEINGNVHDSNEKTKPRGGTGAYFHSDEAKCDHHMETFIKCIKASSGSSMDGFSAIKMTALGRPQFLLQFSEILVKWQRFFDFLALRQGKGYVAPLDQKLELNRLQEQLTQLGAHTDFCSLLAGQTKESSGSVDVLDWNTLIDDSIRSTASHQLVVPNVQTDELEPLLKDFTPEDQRQMKRILQRMEELAKHAVENRVRLMVDAEQTYLQPAISRLTLEMQRMYNKRDKPVVFNTYQCYLKEAYDNVTMDLELSRREGWHFAAKLVRGAYMYQERDRAEELGYEDPINPDYESTNRMYHRCLDQVLDDIASNRTANVMVASHNEDTVKHTLRRMSELGLQPTENMVYFGQLLGMCDQISFPLGQAGFPVYKYVPYGPVSEVMPYLSRRAQENRSIMKGAKKERELLWKELKRRLASGELLYSPVH
ncbi:proline dehydrogenase 1, mitochondrial-like [Synchiropus splendidus]|uniref:proline dehydrogenase 1, mitochondrial-like n=1 Tax=Synchiropus splendidus TaxID=270530 RepID=UPI00237D92FA|nr:proline dehydrogenase 1, mitochondrial-like [Synchiropus splendidus]